MQLKSLRLGAVALAGALLLAVALPAPPASAQAADDPAISSLSEAEQLRIQRAVLDRLWGIREFREREIRDLRSGYTSSAAREYLEAQIAWIDDIEQGDPRIMYEQTVERFLPTAISILRPTAKRCSADNDAPAAVSASVSTSAPFTWASRSQW